MKMRAHQQGVTLMISLIMLVVLTLFAVSAMTMSGTNLKIVGNMQARQEASAAAQQAIEQILSTNFTSSTAAQNISVDINNDTASDYTVNVATLSCISSAPITNLELDPINNPEDKKCSYDQGTGSPGCYNQQWDIQATVTDNLTGTQLVQHQGAKIRVKAGTTC